MSTLNQAIEAIEKHVMQGDSSRATHYNEGLFRALTIVKLLLPAEEAQRKEDMKEAWDGAHWYLGDFETWYNQKYKK